MRNCENLPMSPLRGSTEASIYTPLRQRSISLPSSQEIGSYNTSRKLRIYEDIICTYSPYPNLSYNLFHEYLHANLFSQHLHLPFRTVAVTFFKN